jgi:hypothetical protein
MRCVILLTPPIGRSRTLLSDTNQVTAALIRSMFYSHTLASQLAPDTCPSQQMHYRNLFSIISIYVGYSMTEPTSKESILTIEFT